MSERPDARPEEQLADSVAGREERDRAEELTHASEAAAEHTVLEPDSAFLAEVEKLKADHAALSDKYLRLQAEFDNARKRNAKERLELLQFAGESVLKNVLPVVDDMDRAISNNEKTDDMAVVKEGFHLIRQKMLNILGAQGLRPMTDLVGQPFDVDRHEGITKAPAPEEGMKGKVIDVLESGWTLHDKVVRYAKVVVGE